MKRYVIIGAGPAGVTAAETLRVFAENLEIIMLTGEPYPPYSPPAMVEYFLSGRPVHFWKGENFTEKLGIDYRSNSSVRKINPATKAVELANGETINYDKLLLAAGARLYSPLKGSDKKGIHNFKSLLAGEKMLDEVRAGRVKTSLIVGAGFIGVEIALLLIELGLQVRMLVRSRVMREMLDPETSAIVKGTLLERGVEIIEGNDADALEFVGSKSVEAIKMRSGIELKADLIIAATGLKPNLELLKDSGVKYDWGILVDNYLCTNISDIYAAGDIAETIDRLSGRRYAHANYPNAVAQGRIAALNMLGHNVEYTGSDSMNSLKHLGIPVMAAGIMEGEEIRIRTNDNLRKIWIRDGKLVGFRLAGDINSAGIFLSLMRRSVDITSLKEELLDTRFGMGFLIDSALDPSRKVIY
ncbi:MAG: FAD-dependent oxidoreductase [Bacillota bacterium]|nr:FAD-dependent oxidoreductase [Bacillota bacterium]